MLDMEGAINLAELIVSLCKLTIEPFKLVVCRRKSSLNAIQSRKLLYHMVSLVNRREIVEK